MSDLTIWDQLAVLEGACEHTFKPLCEQCAVLKCERCGMRHWPNFAGAVPLVGDGRNEERFNSLDALVGLMKRLQLRMTIGLDFYDRITPGCSIRIFHPNKPDEFICCGEDDDPRLALATAILRAMGVGV